MDLERVPATSAAPASIPSTLRSGNHQVAIDVGTSGDDFDMEIERGGAVVSLPPHLSGGHMSGRPSGGPASRPGGVSGRPHVASSTGSGLDIAYERESARAESSAPDFTLVEKLVANVVAGVGFALALGALIKLAHRPGGRSVVSLLPHAFDATSSTQSGIFALASLALAIGLGFAGLKMHPRSYAITGSAAAVLLAALAMVTVTLIATEEHPPPPDGALLIPYLVPLALLLLGLGTVGRGALAFLDGGAARRAFAVALGALGGVFVFAAIELSALLN